MLAEELADLALPTGNSRTYRKSITVPSCGGTAYRVPLDAGCTLRASGSSLSNDRSSKIGIILGWLSMNTVHEIENAVSKLSREELSVFRSWFQEFDADAWDQQFEADVKAGRLEALAEEALRDLHEGRCTDL